MTRNDKKEGVLESILEIQIDKVCRNNVCVTECFKTAIRYCLFDAVKS